jgi:hypothetical protein
VTDFPILQIDGASIPRQRLGKQLLTLLCNSWLRIPTFPTQRILLCFLNNEDVATTMREAQSAEVTTRGSQSNIGCQESKNVNEYEGSICDNEKLVSSQPSRREDI